MKTEIRKEESSWCQASSSVRVSENEHTAHPFLLLNTAVLIHKPRLSDLQP